MTLEHERVDAPPALRIDPAIRRRHRPHIVTDVVAVLVVLIAIGFLLTAATNPNFGWPVIFKYLFDPSVLSGLFLTFWMTIAAMAIAIAVAVAIASFRMSQNRILRSVAWTYVWFFRCVPTLVLLLLLYNISILIPRIVIGVPFGPALFAISTQQLINGLITGIAVFGFQQAAYTSEIVRSALQAIPTGQHEAASAIGMTPWQRMRLIVMPQAFRIALPPIANDTINLMKSTSLLAFIAVSDLLYSVQQIYTQNYQIIPLLMVACFWYVVLVSALSIVQTVIESYLRTGRVALRPGALGALRREAEQRGQA